MGSRICALYFLQIPKPDWSIFGRTELNLFGSLQAFWCDTSMTLLLIMASIRESRSVQSAPWVRYRHGSTVLFPRYFQGYVIVSVFYAPGDKRKRNHESLKDIAKNIWKPLLFQRMLHLQITGGLIRRKAQQAEQGKNLPSRNTTRLFFLLPVDSLYFYLHNE